MKEKKMGALNMTIEVPTVRESGMGNDVDVL